MPLEFSCHLEMPRWLHERECYTSYYFTFYVKFLTDNSSNTGVSCSALCHAIPAYSPNIEALWSITMGGEGGGEPSLIASVFGFSDDIWQSMWWQQHQQIWPATWLLAVVGLAVIATWRCVGVHWWWFICLGGGCESCEVCEVWAWDCSYIKQCIDHKKKTELKNQKH